jgi:hypothetical protein
MTKEEKEEGYITENTGKRGVSRDTNECFSGFADPSTWRAGNLCMVVELKNMRRGKEVLTKRLQLHFHEYGEGSFLGVWNGMETIGHINGQDLRDFLLGALARTYISNTLKPTFDAAAFQASIRALLGGREFPAGEEFCKSVIDEGREEEADGNHDFAA